MILPAVNLLAYGFNPDAEHHARSHAWLEDVINGTVPYGISPQVLSSVTRILTNKRIFPRPQELSGVLAYCNRLLDQPHCQIVLPGPRQWQIFCDLCEQTAAKGDLTADAWFAALAMESGCEWITLDRDFARFPGL